MKRSQPLWLTRVVVFALALSVFAACDDDTTGTDGTLDPTEAAATMDEVVASFIVDNDAAQSLDVFGSFISGALGGDVVALEVLPDPDDDGLTNWANRVRLDVAQASGEVANIPEILQGVTFVFDPVTSQYVPDETRTDAPANGVRFILYAVDPVLGQPLDPLQEIGYLDIVDTSTLPTAAISLTAVVNGVTLIDVDVTGTFSQTSSSISLIGFLSDGTDQLDFNFDINGTETTASLDFEASFGNFTVGLTFTGDSAVESGTFTASFSDGQTTITFTLSVESGIILDGSGITISDGTSTETVAIISGTLENVTVTNAAGDPLTEAELQALEQLFEGIGDVFELFFEIFVFSTFLLGLAF